MGLRTLRCPILSSLKVVTHTGERPKGDHILARALGLGLMFPVPVKALIMKAAKQTGLLPSTVMRGSCTKQGTQSVL